MILTRARWCQTTSCPLPPNSPLGNSSLSVLSSCGILLMKDVLRDRFPAEPSQMTHMVSPKLMILLHSSQSHCSRRPTMLSQMPTSPGDKWTLERIWCYVSWTSRLATEARSVPCPLLIQHWAQPNVTMPPQWEDSYHVPGQGQASGTYHFYDKP